MSNLNIPQGGDSSSKIDLLTGKHTRDIIVFIIVIALLIAISYNKTEENVRDRLLDALIAMIGFFAGSKLTNN